MSEIVNLSPSLRSLNPKISPLVPPRQLSSSFYQQPRLKFLSFPGKSILATGRVRAIDARRQEVDDSPVSVELGPISSESHFDEVMEEAQRVGESVVIVWMAAWCRKCIYLRPKLEKLAAEFYPRLRFYHVDVNAVPYKLVSRAGVTLWRDNQKQAEVIGGHKAHFVVNEVREMIENDSIT
ncbi:thioredoxin-like 3-2, chloroplastic isoform X2 [Brassica napus]|uniref:thioredoxin-like 3-2, chloroplastic isoform X2 n=1 Tax=Brassica napus TaxID=3708 RepID=UPI00207889BD|nr:thioredoxin-like 3-2, chloroplastic isoform X2 [Brassica napus]